MADIFISYAKADQAAASVVHQQLLADDVSVFMADRSIEPGADWKSRIEREIQTARLVLVLASRVGCQSAWVQNEVGMAAHARRKIIPVIWDMPASDLPGVLSGYQALDLANRTPEQVQVAFDEIRKGIHLDKWRGLAVLAVALYAIVKLG